MELNTMNDAMLWGMRCDLIRQFFHGDAGSFVVTFCRTAGIRNKKRSASHHHTAWARWSAWLSTLRRIFLPEPDAKSFNRG
jgi:hypothetical protein